MKNSYPIILTPDEPGYMVYSPDFGCSTEGRDLTEALEMGRDAIGLMGITMEDEGKQLPQPSDIRNIQKTAESNDIVTLVDVDFSEYRREISNLAVKKNCTIPSWLCYKAEKANINFSQVLQAGLKEALGIE